MVSPTVILAEAGQPKDHDEGQLRIIAILQNGNNSISMSPSITQATLELELACSRGTAKSGYVAAKDFSLKQKTKTRLRIDVF